MHGVSVAVLALCIAAALAPASSLAAVAGYVPGESLSMLSPNAGRGHADPAGLGAAITELGPAVLVLVETSELMIQAVDQAMAEWQFTNRSGPVESGERLTPSSSPRMH